MNEINIHLPTEKNKSILDFAYGECFTYDTPDADEIFMKLHMHRNLIFDSPDYVPNTISLINGVTRTIPNDISLIPYKIIMEAYPE
jgi:hypothetical protein